MQKGALRILKNSLRCKEANDFLYQWLNKTEHIIHRMHTGELEEEWITDELSLVKKDNYIKRLKAKFIYAIKFLLGISKPYNEAYTHIRIDNVLSLLKSIEDTSKIFLENPQVAVEERIKAQQLIENIRMIRHYLITKKMNLIDDLLEQTTTYIGQVSSHINSHISTLLDIRRAIYFDLVENKLVSPQDLDIIPVITESELPHLLKKITRDFKELIFYHQKVILDRKNIKKSPDELSKTITYCGSIQQALEYAYTVCLGKISHLFNELESIYTLEHTIEQLKHIALLAAKDDIPSILESLQALQQFVESLQEKE